MRYLGVIPALAGLAVLAGTAFPAWPPPPSPSGSSQLSPTELRYRLIGRLGDPFYCDPDVYPVSREVPAAEVRRRVLDRSTRDPELFQGITAQLGIADPTALTDDQVSQIYGGFKRLAAVQLEPAAGGYRFVMQVDAGGR